MQEESYLGHQIERTSIEVRYDEAGQAASGKQAHPCDHHAGLCGRIPELYHTGDRGTVH